MTTTTTQTAIDISQLTKNYGRTTALDQLDLRLDYGQVVGLLGENGCGKTTLLKILAGVLDQYSGEVSIAGHHIGAESKAQVAFLPDTSFLSRNESVGNYFRAYQDFFADFDLERARSLLTHFGIAEDQRLKTMSKGMREKAQVALILGRRAKVYLLDEPISGIDPAARQIILDAIIDSISPDSVMVIATHLIHDLEPILEDVVIMRHGTVLIHDDAETLRGEHQISIDQLFRKVYQQS